MERPCDDYLYEDMMNISADPPRLPVITLLLFSMNVLLYLIQICTGVNWMIPSVESILQWGGNTAAYTLVDQPWRLLTCMFLHVGLLHLAMNMYMLLAMGITAERCFGRVRFLLVYLLSGLIASLASALWHADPGNQVVAAGASGALMGLCGAYIASWLVADWSDYEHEGTNLRGPLLQTVLINLAIGARSTSIDNVGHVGGLAGGFVIGAVFALAYYRYDGIKGAAAIAAVSSVVLGGTHMKLQGPPSSGLASLIELRTMDQSAQHRAEAQDSVAERTGSL